MCFTFKKNNQQTKKPVNRFLQDDASAGKRSLQTSIELNLLKRMNNHLIMFDMDKTTLHSKLKETFTFESSRDSGN